LLYPLEGRTFNPEDPATFHRGRYEAARTDALRHRSAVHPDDERYADLVGSTVILPLVGRKIPILATNIPIPEKGSGRG